MASQGGVAVGGRGFVSPEGEIMVRYRDLVLMFRFYAVLRRFGYLDPLIYSLDIDQIREVITQALREYSSYFSSAPNRAVNVCGKVVEVPCLEIAKLNDVPRQFEKLFPDVIHTFKENNEDKYCIVPIKCIDNDVVVAMPSDSVVMNFMERLSGDIRYARALAELALTAGEKG